MPPRLGASRAERPPRYDIVKYEDGMQILYDVLSKGVFIQFRGKSDFLKGPFPNQREAIRAAEDYCRKLGWGESLSH